jgi:hypothetical protein
MKATLYPVRFEIRLTRHQNEWVEKKAKSWGLTASQLIRNWIDEDIFLTHKDKKGA